MHNIYVESMSYKQQISLSQEQELLAKLRIVKQVKRFGRKQKQVAASFSCHRNTITNILKSFKTLLPLDIQQALIYGDDWNRQDLLTLLLPLQNLSRKPHSHPAQASKAVTDKVIELFNKGIKTGPQRFTTIIKRKLADSNNPIEQQVRQLSLASTKGIFKRNKLRITKVKSGNGQKRALYDYQSLACFSCLHYDVKHILDHKALPDDIYHGLATNQELPLYQWTIQDVKSRFRFLAYSRNINAEFGLKFLIFTLCFIRFTLANWDQEIIIGLDNGVEFCCGSKDKEKQWNQILSSLKSEIYTYHPGHDIRKNLIERSHLTDDEELYIPRGDKMTNLPSFMKEARAYLYYFNFQRAHSGIAMNNRTPFELIQASGLSNTTNLLKFPVIVLEDEIEVLRKATDQILLLNEIQQYQIKTQRLINLKKLIDLSLKYDFFKPNFAQNVLTHYQVEKVMKFLMLMK